MLPVEARPNRWGDEIYFSIPAWIIQSKNAVEEVDSRRPRVLASGEGVLHFLRPDAGEQR